VIAHRCDLRIFRCCFAVAHKFKAVDYSYGLDSILMLLEVCAEYIAVGCADVLSVNVVGILSSSIVEKPYVDGTLVKCLYRLRCNQVSQYLSNGL